MPTDPNIVTPDDASPSYQLPDQAADAISKDFGSKDIEQAGVVFKKPDGTYSYSTVAPSQQADTFALRARMPQGYSLAAIVHSHPGNDADGQVFSGNDLDVADQLKVPSFVRFNKDNSIRKYTPGVTKTQRQRMVSSMQSQRTAQGDPISQPVGTTNQQIPDAS